MRTYKLARIAAQAELLRLRRRLRRHSTRAVLAAIAAVFGIAALVAGHVAGAMALTQWVTPIYAALIVAGIDLLVALIFALVAMRDVPDSVEEEALRVRLTAQEQMLQGAAMTTLAVPVLRMLGLRKASGLSLAALTAWYFGSAR